MKKIIVPIDFSKHSEYALKTAALLAKEFNAIVYVLHMLDIQELSLSESETYQHEKAAFFLKLAEKKFNNFLVKEYLDGVKIIPIIKHYKVFSEVNAIALEVDADLIIMGSHGASGLKEFFVGSNTEKVVRYSNLPVLVIKNETINTDFSDIVVATDFSEETLANNFLMKAEGDAHRLINVNYVCARSVEKGILNFANVVGADLISVITHGRKGLSHIFAGSIAEDLTNHSTLPIITLKI